MKTDFIHSIPETEPIGLTRPTSRISPSRVAHYVLQYDEIALGRFLNVPVNCNFLSVVSTYPIVVIADGEPIITTEEAIPSLRTGAQGSPTWEPSFIAGAGGLDSVRLRPGLSFVIRRHITSLSIRVGGDTAEYATAEVPGSVHLFIGQANTDAIDFGLPISHSFEVTAAPAAALATISGIRPTLHGNNGVAPTSGLRWIPSRSELYGMAIVPVWTGAAGVLDNVRITMQGQAANRFRLGGWKPRLETVDFDFGAALEIPVYQTRDVNAVDDRGALELTISATQVMTSVAAELRFRSFM